MVTFYQCFQEYLTTPGAYQFSKKDTQRISNYCRDVYDRRPGNPVSYTTSVEGDQTFSVRSYPDTFKRTIHGLLWRMSNLKKENILKAQEAIDKKAAKKAAIKPVAKVRKRTPVKQPAYSMKPVKL